MFRNAPVREWIEMGPVRGAATEFITEGRREWLLKVATGRLADRALLDWSHDLTETLTGRKWWQAETLLVTSGNPDVLGELVLARVDPDTVTLGEWCAAVWRILVRDLDKEGRGKLEMELSLPPKGYEDAWDDDEEYYAAMLAQAGRFGA